MSRYAPEVRTRGTLTRKHVSTQSTSAREHISMQGTLAHEHVNTQGTLARKHVFSTFGTQFSRLTTSGERNFIEQIKAPIFLRVVLAIEII